MRTLASRRLGWLVTLGAAAVGLVQGCAAFADLPDYQLAPAAGQGGGGASGEAGAAGSVAGAAGSSAGGAPAGGNGGATGGASANGGASGSAANAGAAGEAGSSGASAGEGGMAGAGGAAGSTAAGQGGIAGEGGATGVGGAGQAGGGLGGSGGNAGAASGGGGSAGASGGAAGQAGSGGTAGAGGLGGAAGSSAGAGGSAGATGGQGGSPAVFPPEIVAQAQIDPGTILLDSGLLYWVNRNGGGSGQVSRLALPGPTPDLSVAPTYVQPSVSALKDIAFYASRLFVLRGAGKAQQNLLTSFQANGTDEIVIHTCVDKPAALLVPAVPCDVTSMNRLVSAPTGVYFSGQAVGTDSSVVQGTKACAANAGSCQAFLTEAPPTNAMTAITSALFSVPSANKKQITRSVSGSSAAFVTLTDDVLDLANDGTNLFALTSGGRVVSIAIADKSQKVLVATGAGSGGQRVVTAGDAVYWTASGPAAGQGIVGRVKKDGSAFLVLTGDRQGPRGLAVDTSTGAPHVYFTDASNTVQRVRLPLARPDPTIFGVTATSVLSSRDRLAYLAQQRLLVRGLGTVLRTVVRTFAKDPPPPPTPSEVAIMDARLAELWEADLRHVAEGAYPRELLFQLPAREYLRALPSIARDLPQVAKRVEAKNHQDLPADLDVERYPAYYRRNFHWQTDGWFSESSAARYDATVEMLFGGTADVMRRMAIPPLTRALKGKSAPRILDVASGTGRFLSQLHVALPRARLVGIDLSVPYCAHARKSLAHIDDLSIVADNAEKMPFADDLFDAVTSVFLFHELPKDARRNVMREMNRVLAPGGLCVINDSAQLVESPELARMLETFPAGYHEPYYKGYVQDPLENALAECGFEIVSSTRAMVSKVVVARKAFASAE